MPEIDWEKLEDKAYDHQEAEIRRHHGGRKAAEHANYGWSVYEADDFERISTKVYTYGILTTIIYADGTMKDSWEDF
jgi:hypothetical protein